MTYNRIDDVRNRLDLSEEVMRNEEIQQELERAYRTVRMKVGKEIIDRFIVTNIEENSVNLRFNDIKSVSKVLLNGKEVDTANYSVDLVEGVITFSNISFAYRDLIEVFYIPRIFEELELLYAEYYILLHRNIVGEGEVRKARIDEIKELIKNMINEINQTSNVIGVADHYEYYDSTW